MIHSLSSILRQPWGVAAVAFSLLVGGNVAWAQNNTDAPAPDAQAASAAPGTPGAPEVPGVRETSDPMAPEMPGVTVIEHLGDTAPLDLPFVDEHGLPVTLADYTSDNKPIILMLNYYRCPMLCGLVMNGVAAAVEKMSLTPGTDYQLVTVSIDPAETPSLARMKKGSYVAAMGEKMDPDAIEEGWAFLTGEQHNITALADAVGFGYQWVESEKQYAHPAALILLSPDGKITRYLYGIEYDPDTLRLSLVESSAGKVGSTLDRFLLTCFHFDPTTGTYSLMAINLMRWGGALVVVLLAGTIGVLLLREQRGRVEQSL